MFQYYLRSYFVIALCNSFAKHGEARGTALPASGSTGDGTFCFALFRGKGRGYERLFQEHYEDGSRASNAPVMMRRLCQEHIEIKQRAGRSPDDVRRYHKGRGSD